MYLNLLDETEGLLQLFEGAQRQSWSLWLSLPDDTDVTRSSWQRIASMQVTRHNYTVVAGSECRVLFKVFFSVSFSSLSILYKEPMSSLLKTVHAIGKKMHVSHRPGGWKPKLQQWSSWDFDADSTSTWEAIRLLIMEQVLQLKRETQQQQQYICICSKRTSTLKSSSKHTEENTSRLLLIA